MSSVTLITEDPLVQADRALELLSKAITDLDTQILLSVHAGKDKATLETTSEVAKQAYKVLVEMRKQMNGQDWDREVVSKEWFADGSSEGYSVFADLAWSTKRNLERALNYSINVNLTGRFVRLGADTKEKVEDAAPSAPVAYGLLALVAVAIIAIVVLR